MKKYIVAIIVTSLGALLLSLNTKEHYPPLEEAPVAVVEAAVEPIVPEVVPEPIPVVEAVVEPVQAPPVSNQNGRCGDNFYANAIYMGESSCRMDVVNSIGACGLGQSLPCSKLESSCPDWRTNYDCQNAWFTAYAMSYGSWEAAYNFKFCTGYCYSTRTKTTVFKPTSNPWW